MDGEVRTGGAPCRGVEQQCLVRDANEVTESANERRPVGAERLPFRCECGDPACTAEVHLTHAEYEAVRYYGSHFLVRINHENGENACVLREISGAAVIDVVTADARYMVLARNQRHVWMETEER